MIQLTIMISLGEGKDPLMFFQADSVKITVAVVLSGLSLLGASGNVLLCYIIFNTKDSTCFLESFVVSLACSDIIVCLAVFPISLIFHLETNNSSQSFVVCSIWQMLDTAMCVITIYTMLAMCLSLWNAEKKGRQISKNAKTWFIIASIWSAGFLTGGIPLLVGSLSSLAEVPMEERHCLFTVNTYFVAIYIFIAIFPLIWCIVLFARILEYQRSKRTTADIGESRKSKNCILTIREIHVRDYILTSGVKISIFAVSRLPYFVIKCLHSFCGENCVNPTADIVALWLTHFSSWLNPFIFVLLNRRLNRQFMLCGSKTRQKANKMFCSTNTSETMRESLKLETARAHPVSGDFVNNMSVDEVKYQVQTHICADFQQLSEESGALRETLVLKDNVYSVESHVSVETTVCEIVNTSQQQIAINSLDGIKSSVKLTEETSEYISTHSFQNAITFTDTNIIENRKDFKECIISLQKQSCRRLYCTSFPSIRTFDYSVPASVMGERVVRLSVSQTFYSNHIRSYSYINPRDCFRSVCSLNETCIRCRPSVNSIKSIRKSYPNSNIDRSRELYQLCEDDDAKPRQVRSGSIGIQNLCEICDEESIAEEVLTARLNSCTKVPECIPMLPLKERRTDKYCMVADTNLLMSQNDLQVSKEMISSKPEHNFVNLLPCNKLQSTTSQSCVEKYWDTFGRRQSQGFRTQIWKKEKDEQKLESQANPLDMTKQHKTGPDYTDILDTHYHPPDNNLTVCPDTWETMENRLDQHPYLEHKAYSQQLVFPSYGDSHVSPDLSTHYEHGYNLSECHEGLPKTSSSCYSNGKSLAKPADTATANTDQHFANCALCEPQELGKDQPRQSQNMRTLTLSELHQRRKSNACDRFTKHQTSHEILQKRLKRKAAAREQREFDKIEQRFLQSTDEGKLAAQKAGEGECSDCAGTHSYRVAPTKGCDHGLSRLRQQPKKPTPSNDSVCSDPDFWGGQTMKPSRHRHRTSYERKKKAALNANKN